MMSARVYYTTVTFAGEAAKRALNLAPIITTQQARHTKYATYIETNLL